GFCGRMPPKPGPPKTRRGCAGSARRVARRMRASSWNAHGRTSHEPRSNLANLEGRRPGRRAFGGVLSLVTFFAQAKKGTRSPAGGVEALLLKRQGKIKMDSGLRRNHEQERERVSPAPAPTSALARAAPACRRGHWSCRV